MRSISSVRVTASIGTLTSSFTIARSRSCSCRTLTSLACVNNRWQKVSVNAALHLPRHQRRETQKSFLVHVSLLGDFYLGGIRQQHPHRNFQTPPCWIDDRDRAIFPFRSPQNPKGTTVKRVKAVEDLDVRGFCAQGTVGAGASIRISISSFPRAASRSITPAGSTRGTTTSCPSRFCARSFAASSSQLSARPSRMASFASPKS